MLAAIRILLVDDSDLVRKSVRNLIAAHHDLQIIAEASDGIEAVRFAKEHLPHVVVLDISMPNLNGFGAAPQILVVSSNSAILFFSQHDSDAIRYLARKAGGLGHVAKNDAAIHLVNAIRSVHQGKEFFSGGEAVRCWTTTKRA